MADENVTLIILSADRKLWGGGPTELEVKDMRAGLKRFKRQSLAASYTILTKLKLLFGAGQVDGISVAADKHRSAWQLIKRRLSVREEAGCEIEVGGLTMRLMLVPEKSTSLDLDGGYALLAAAGSPLVSSKTGLSKNNYLKLRPPAKMALLNIDAQLRATRVKGAPWLSFVESLRHVAVDRLSLFMRSELKQFIENSAEFASASGHKATITPRSFLWMQTLTSNEVYYTWASGWTTRWAKYARLIKLRFTPWFSQGIIRTTHLVQFSNELTAAHS